MTYLHTNIGPQSSATRLFDYPFIYQRLLTQRTFVLATAQIGIEARAMEKMSTMRPNHTLIGALMHIFEANCTFILQAVGTANFGMLCFVHDIRQTSAARHAVPVGSSGPKTLADPTDSTIRAVKQAVDSIRLSVQFALEAHILCKGHAALTALIRRTLLMTTPDALHVGNG